MKNSVRSKSTERKSPSQSEKICLPSGKSTKQIRFSIKNGRESLLSRIVMKKIVGNALDLDVKKVVNVILLRFRLHLA